MISNVKCNCRGEINDTEELHLFCYWKQLGNKWVEIAKLMGRSENWVKNNWKRLLKRERIANDDNIIDKVTVIIEKLTKALEDSCSMMVDPLTSQEDYDNNIFLSLDNFVTARSEIKEVKGKRWPAFASEEDRLGEIMELNNEEKASTKDQSIEMSIGSSEIGSLTRFDTIDKSGSGLLGSNFSLNFNYGNV